MGTFAKLAAATVGILVVALWITRPWESTDRSSPDHPQGAVPVIAGEEELGRTKPGASIESGEERISLSTSPTEPAAVTARLRVIDELGRPLPDARAAWLDARGGIVTIELDEQGSAPLLEAWEGARVFATHQGLAPGHARLESGEQDLVLTLVKNVEVFGRVVEDGGPPRRPIRLSLSWDAEVTGLGSREWEIGSELERRGLLPEREVLWTEPDGSFRFTGQRLGARGDIRLPNTHVVTEVQDAPSDSEWYAPVLVDGSPLRIETITVPIVEGRLVWRDDGSPVEDGYLHYQRADREGDPGPGRDVFADPDGHFAVGLRDEGWRQLSPEQRTDFAERLGTLHFRVIETRSDSARGRSLDLPLVGLSFPHDMGTIELDRTRRVAVRVLDADGLPLAGAAISSDVGRTRTDTAGEVILPCWGSSSEEIIVLAPGHALGRFSLDDAPATEGEWWELRLEPGIELLFRMEGADGGPLGNVQLEVSWDETPFARSERSGAPLDHGLHRSFGGRHFQLGSWKTVAPQLSSDMTFQPDSNGEARMIALVPGRPLRLRLLHEYGYALLEREILTPPQPGVETVTLIVPAAAAGDVVFRGSVTDEHGERLPDARIMLHIGKRWIYLDCDEQGTFESVPFQPRVLTYAASARGHVRLEETELELSVGQPPITIVLPVARKVELQVKDEAGRPLRPVDIETTDASGRTYRGQRSAPGLARFSALPCEPLELALTVGWHRWTQAIGAEDHEATFVLPEHGALTGSLKRTELLPDSSLLVLIADARDGSEPLRVEEWLSFPEDAPGPFTVETDLLPGTYRVEVLSGAYSDDEGDELIETVLVPARVVTVEVGRTTTVSPGR